MELAIDVSAPCTDDIASVMEYWMAVTAATIVFALFSWALAMNPICSVWFCDMASNRDASNWVPSACTRPSSEMACSVGDPCVPVCEDGVRLPRVDGALWSPDK